MTATGGNDELTGMHPEETSKQGRAPRRRLYQNGRVAGLRNIDHLKGSLRTGRTIPSAQPRLRTEGRVSERAIHWLASLFGSMSECFMDVS